MTIRSRAFVSSTAVAFLLVSLGAACDDSDGDSGQFADGGTDANDSNDSNASETGTADANAVAPQVTANNPTNSAASVALNASVSVTFDMAMDRDSLNANSFMLKLGNTAVPGTVIYGSRTAVFRPSARLAASTLYTATITTAVKSGLGVPMAANHTFGFTTGTNVAAPLPVNLASAGNFVILAKSAISTVPPSVITGNIAVSPASATAITEFSLIADPSAQFSKSSQVTGNVYAANYAAPTPANLTAAVSDMELAFTDAAGRAADVTELGAGDIGGKTLAPGVYSWASGLLIPTDLALTGTATDVWIFQVAQNLTMSSGKSITLSGGALAKNVFWQVSGFVEIGTTAHFEGTVMSQTAITLRTGASIKGRLLAQTAVVLQSSTVTVPAM
ncbi:MAG: ice-binding family protein [Deltaproteobacteria bacterium]|nr:ice-binding family protein [Deltaproteobacteria bacterium]